MTNLLNTGSGGGKSSAQATSAFSRVPKTQMSAKGGGGMSLAALPQNTKVALTICVAGLALLAITLPLILGSGSGEEQASAEQADAAEGTEPGAGLLPESLSAEFTPIESGSAASNESSQAQEASATGSDEGSAASSQGASERATTHVLKRGETLSHVARQYYGASSRWRVIAEANGLSETEVARLQAGTELKIPATEDFRSNTDGSESSGDSQVRESRNNSESRDRMPSSEGGLIDPSAPSGDFTPLGSSSSTPRVRMVERTVYPGGTHTLREGDTHFRLASHYYGPEHLMEALRIREANPQVDWSDIEPGTRVKIPELTVEVEETVPQHREARRSESRGTSQGSTRSHTIARGETLSGIARQYYSSSSSRYVRKIQEANGIDNPTAIREGDQLTIPR